MSGNAMLAAYSTANVPNVMPQETASFASREFQTW
jgi:hypothetical protein